MNAPTICSPDQIISHGSYTIPANPPLPIKPAVVSKPVEAAQPAIEANKKPQTHSPLIQEKVDPPQPTKKPTPIKNASAVAQPKEEDEIMNITLGQKRKQKGVE